MITVAGEALMDLVSSQSGALDPVPGGAPFNVARFAAQLGAKCFYAGTLSEDTWGSQLQADLETSGVTLAVPERVDAPTTIAVAQLDDDGVADYRFYLDGTAAAQLRPKSTPRSLLEKTGILVLGGIALTVEPSRSALLSLVESAREQTIVVLDPNCRPAAVGDIRYYRQTIDRLLARVDVLKVSVEDLATLSPDQDPVDFATGVTRKHPALVLISNGADDLTVVTRNYVHRLPVPEANVVDTIGAGDALVAGLVQWLATNPKTDPRSVALDNLLPGLDWATRVASAVCSTPGAQLPVAWRRLGG